MHTRLPDYIPVATPITPQRGRFKITVSAHAINTQGKPLTMAFLCRPIRERSAHELIVCHDVPENKSTVFEAEFDMNRETNIRVGAWGLPTPYEFFLKKVKPPLQDYTGPGLVIDWIEFTGPIGVWPPESYQRLFKDVPLKARSVVKAEADKRPIPKIGNRPASFAEDYDPLVPASANPRGRRSLDPRFSAESFAPPSQRGTAKTLRPAGPRSARPEIHLCRSHDLWLQVDPFFSPFSVPARVWLGGPDRQEGLPFDPARRLRGRQPPVLFSVVLPARSRSCWTWPGTRS